MAGEEELQRMLKDECDIVFDVNPQRVGAQKHEVFENVRTATTVSKAKELGASAWDIREWYKKGAVSAAGNPAVSPNTNVAASVERLEKLKKTMSP